MIRIPLLISALALLTACGRGVTVAPASAAPTPPRIREIDLAATPPGADVVTRGSGRIDGIRLINAIPDVYYDVAASLERLVTPPLGAPGSETLYPSDISGCASLDTARVALSRASDEDEVSAGLRRLRERVASTPDSVCSATDKKSLLAAAEASTTRLVMLAVDPEDDEDIVIRVSRSGIGSGSRTEWTRRYAGTPDGRWQSMYTFAAAHAVGPVRDYYAAPTATAFAISERPTRRRTRFVPAIQYTYVPARTRSGWGHGATAGIGVDLTDPSAFFGWTFVKRENIAVTLAGLLHGYPRLRSQYDVGQEIGSTLDEDQLTERGFRVSPMIGVSFRLGSTPFSVPPSTRTNEEAP